MPLEIEQKFRVSDHTAVIARLTQFGTLSLGEIEQRDTYYAHPARDFAQTDEALRIRRVGDESCVTYKGPKLDSTTKTRREIELPIASAVQFGELLEALGFTPVADVAKRRRIMRVERPPFSIEVALDKINDLGNFVELEVVAEPADLDAARAKIAQLASELGLTNSERRSYLELLIAATTEPSAGEQ
ncbi:MAG: class IV adenylate cyclase [Pirellulales bacterium]